MGSPPRTLGILSDEPKPRRGWDRESGDAATSINDTASSKQRVRQELERERQADQVVKPPNMNYANMIEEKHLKKGFIIATLVSTLVGTITASMTLKDKVQEQRNKNKQQALDKTQDAKIKELTEKIGKLEQAESADKDKKDKDDTKSQRSSRSSSRRRRRRRDDDDDDDDYEDDFNYNARRSRAMIERMYEDHLRRVGLDYAQGDVITENKLQAQIIQLQQTVINVLQDALYSGRSLTQGDMQRLIEAQHAARENSLDALQGQFARMQAQKKTLQPVKKAYLLNDDPPPPPKQLTFPVRNGSTRSHSPPSPRKVKTLPVAPPPRLFCRYSETIQTTKQFLSRAFTPSGDGRCPGCRVSLPVDTRDVWVFSTQIPSSTPGGPVKKKEFQMDARFVVKCHTEDGRFACVVCHRLRDKDCICRDVDALIKHLATFHTPGEFEKDDDLISMKSGSQVSGRALVLAT